MKPQARLPRHPAIRGLGAACSIAAVAGSLAFAAGADAAIPTSTYRANGDARDSTSTHDGRWSGSQAYAPGRSGVAGDLAFDLDGRSKIVMDGEVGLFGTEDARVSFSVKTTDRRLQSLVGKRQQCNNASPQGWWDVRLNESGVGVEFGGGEERRGGEGGSDGGEWEGGG